MGCPTSFQKPELGLWQARASTNFATGAAGLRSELASSQSSQEC